MSCDEEKGTKKRGHHWIMPRQRISDDPFSSSNLYVDELDNPIRLLDSEGRAGLQFPKQTPEYEYSCACVCAFVKTGHTETATSTGLNPCLCPNYNRAVCNAACTVACVNGQPGSWVNDFQSLFEDFIREKGPCCCEARNQ